MKNYLLFSFLFFAFGYANIYAQTGGSVGIGDTNPTEAKLVVRSLNGADAIYTNNPIRSESSGVGLFLNNNSNTSGGSIQIGSTGIRIDGDDIDKASGPLFLNYNYSGGVNIANGGGGVQLATGTAGGNVTMVTSSGNVGIGTSSPSAKLDVVGNARFNSDLTLNGSSLVFNNTSSGFIALPSSTLSQYGANGILFSTGTSLSNRMWISASGNVGIGAASPSNRLYVSGTARITGNTELNGNLRADNYIYTDSYVEAKGKIYVDDVPVWDESNDYDLTWNGTATAGLRRISRKGSSLRYKQNVKDAEIDFAQLLDMKVKQYNMRPEYGNGTDWILGMIAEEMDEAGIKELVIYNAEGRPDGIKYKKIPLYLLEIAKKQEETIQDQQKEIDQLKARLDRIEAMLDK